MHGLQEETGEKTVNFGNRYVHKSQGHIKPAEYSAVVNWDQKLYFWTSANSRHAATSLKITLNNYTFCENIVMWHQTLVMLFSSRYREASQS